MLCPCCSQKEYSKCCEPYHLGKSAPTAAALMRSRYSAYAKHRVDYIILTTHPDHHDASTPLAKRKKSIQTFCDTTEFVGLEILEEIEGEPFSYVTFRAHLKQNGQDTSFVEKSTFAKRNGKWFYLSGSIENQ